MFMEQAAYKYAPLRSQRGTLVVIRPREATVRHESVIGGEIFVPKIPSYRITDVAKTIAPDCKLNYIGIRPGEKIHEEMITESDSLNTIDLGKYYAILPTAGDASIENYLTLKDCKRVKTNFSYNSGDNDIFLTVDQLKALVRQQKQLGLLQ